MPGAWEFSGPDTLVVILTRELVTMRWSKHFKEMELPPGCTASILSGMPFDHARNNGCEAALKGGFRRVFFLDDDVCPPPNIINHLKSLNQPIVSGLYYRRHEPIAPVAIRLVNGASQWVTQFDPNIPFEVDMVGAGCLMIDRSVLEKMKAPWFEWLCDRPDLPENKRYSEDFAFCMKAREMGYKIWVDPRMSCMHAGLSAVHNGVMAPLKPA